jgi:hypothetical protein
MFLDEYLVINPYKIKGRKRIQRLEQYRFFQTQFINHFAQAMKRYTIRNLPATCSERLIKQSLICQGCVIFFKDKENGGIFALQGYPSGKGFNVNGDPVSGYVFSRNGLFNKEIDLYIPGSDDDKLITEGNVGESTNPKGVIIWENEERYPFIYNVLDFSKAIADTYKTIETNRTWMKIPFIPIVPESMKDAIGSLVDDIEANEKVIPISARLNELERFDIHDMCGREEAIRMCMELIDWYEQKFRECCGFDSNASIDKKGENLLTDEVNFNLDFTNKITNFSIDYLNKQLEIVNKFLGTDMIAEEVEGNDEETGLQSDDTATD